MDRIQNAAVGMGANYQTRVTFHSFCNKILKHQSSSRRIIPVSSLIWASLPLTISYRRLTWLVKGPIRVIVTECQSNMHAQVSPDKNTNLGLFKMANIRMNKFVILTPGMDSFMTQGFPKWEQGQEGKRKCSTRR